MDGSDSDLPAFESNLFAIIQAIESGKTAALASNLCQEASELQSVGISSKDNAQRESHCSTPSHCQICQSDSDDSLYDH